MLVHQELCFGCGRSNLFGLLLEAEPDAGGRELSARCFVKQDHQGPDPGLAHPGVIAAALTEAMALACGVDARVSSFEVSITGAAPVGTFLDLEARREGHTMSAVATSEGSPVARASGTLSV